MQDLKLKVKASTGGEAHRVIATGTRYADGRIEFPSVTEQVPPEILDKLHRYFQELGVREGTQSYKLGNTDYQVSFEH